MTVALVILIVGITFNIFLGILVALKYRDKAAQALVFVAVGLILWELANFMADYPFDPLLWNRLTFLGPLLVGVASYVFLSYLRAQPPSRTELGTIVVGSTLVGILCLTGAVVPEVQSRMMAGMTIGYNPSRGFFYPIYLAWIGLLTLILIIRVFGPIKRPAALLRIQMSFVRIGVVGVLIIPVITSVILPNVFNSSASTQYVPVMSVIYMGALTVAIMKHKLFDIRDIILRATAFSFVNVVLSIVYVAPGVLVIMWLLHASFRPYEIVMAIVLGSLIAVNYNRVYSWFVRVTNRFFFRDNYDPTKLMFELNRSLLMTTNAKKMFHATTRAIEQHLKSSFCYFIVTAKATKDDRYEIYGSVPNDLQPTMEEYVTLFEKSTKHQRLVSAELPDGGLPHHLFEDHQISVVGRLHTTGNDMIGYMVVGQRKSGKAYASADLSVLETLSNTLAIAIQDALHYEEIQKFNQTLQTNVDDATSELRRSNRKLHDLDESKDEFISMASHQLRTPLTTVKGYISMMLDGDVGHITPTQRKVLEEAFNSSQRMVYLIGDFLNVSRLQTGKFELELHTVNMARLVQEEVDQLCDNARSRTITISYQQPHNIPDITLDENKIRQVVMNFIDNAIYYSKPGSTIEVTLTCHSDRLSLRVRDYGIGVPNSERHHLFTKFFRATNAKRQRPDGTGIGLFMARRVVVAHGGTIIFESVENKGSTFGFRLPLDTMKEREQVQSQAKQ